MTMSERVHSTAITPTPLSTVWQSTLGLAAEGLIDFLQTLNDEFDTQPEGSRGVTNMDELPAAC